MHISAPFKRIRFKRKHYWKLRRKEKIELLQSRWFKNLKNSVSLALILRSCRVYISEVGVEIPPFQLFQLGKTEFVDTLNSIPILTRTNIIFSTLWNLFKRIIITLSTLINEIIFCDHKVQNIVWIIDSISGLHYLLLICLL